ncbi:MAG TPA: sulfotransferase [Actinomycetota bacterium]|nr:sulfotransferase [Actinomycetota bacterium]
MARARVGLRSVTSSVRPLPSFLIIGAQRAGTSSLYKYLEGHPGLAASVRKETEYFSRRYGRGETWYRAHFPLLRGRLAYEATPDYLFYPLSPERIRKTIPDARFVVLLRDPVERAYSHYRHMVRLGFEDLPFGEALTREPERLSGDAARLADDPLYEPRAFLRFSYVSRGLYAEQFRRWFSWFPPSRFLVIQSERLFEDPKRAIVEIEQGIGARPWLPRDLRNHSYGTQRPPVPPIGGAERHMLQERLRPEVQELERLLGRSFDWKLGDGG